MKLRRCSQERENFTQKVHKREFYASRIFSLFLAQGRKTKETSDDVEIKLLMNHPWTSQFHIFHD